MIKVLYRLKKQYSSILAKTLWHYLFVTHSFSLIFSVFLLIAFSNCSKEKHNPIITPTHLDLQSSSAPFLLPSGAVFYKNIKYDSASENIFDFFKPSSTQPTGLVIQIHGGGFKSGDKADNYNNPGFQNEVNGFLNNQIAFATLNYRLLLDINEQEGVLKPLTDCKRALQFIRYYFKDFNIDKVKIALKGGSAGAGTCLWLGLNNNMADPNASDPIFKESTRVKAIVANNTQSTYDLLSWPTAVFAEYQITGLDLDSMLAITTMETFLQFYGINDTSQLRTPKMIDYRKTVDMLGVISPDDSDIYLVSVGIPYSFPLTKGNLIHHPLHAKAIMNKATEVGVKCKAYIPEMNIDNTNGESSLDFIIRKLKE